MTYRVIFDVADRLPDIALGAAALVVIAGVGAAALLDIDSVLRRWPLVRGAGGLLASEAVVNRQPLVLGFGLSMALPPGGSGTMLGTFLLLAAMFFGLPMIAAIDETRHLAEGQAKVFEGAVRIVVEVVGKNECISVAGRQFCYSDSNVTPGFNRTRALGGPMHDGLLVRISAIGDTIVRLEVADQP